MLTKTQIKIMQIFCGKITERFSIKQISEILKKPYPLIHRSMQELIKNRLIIKDSKELLSLNYKENHQELAYIESERAREFLKKNNVLALFTKDTLKIIDSDFFILLLFGSSVEKEGRDIDILMISEKPEEHEKILDHIAGNFTKKFDIISVSPASVYEMLSKRDNLNVLNETLNKHIILFGAENFYRMLKNARR